MSGEKSADAVVIGGGPAGLAAAYTLSRAKKQVTVIEQAEVLGGLSKTIIRDGYRFDIGGHRWFTKKHELNAFVHELMGDELLEVPRSSHIYFDGKYFEYPINIRSILGGVNLSVAARALLDYLVSRAPSNNGKGTKARNSMRDAYIAQFGSTLYELFFERYSRKVWGYDCEQLSGDWVVQRTKGLSLASMAKAAITQQSAKFDSLVTQFKYPRLGIGQISLRLGDFVKTSAGKVLLNARVQEIRHKNGHITDVTYVRDGTIYEIASPYFISSVPITELVLNLRPSPPANVLSAAKSLTYRDFITVNVMIDRERVTEDTWIYLHDPHIPFGRLHEPVNWSPFMAPCGKTSLVAEYFCSIGDDIWNTSDSTLCEITTRALTKQLGFVSASDVIDAFAIRSLKAYPTYLIGYESHVRTLKAYLATLKNLQVVGRSGTFRYNNIDHSIETGILAARNVLGETHSIEEVNSEKKYHEAKVW